MNEVKCIEVYRLGMSKDLDTIIVIEADKKFVPSSGKRIKLGNLDLLITGITLNNKPIAPYLPLSNKSYWHLIVTSVDDNFSREVTPFTTGYIY